MEFIIRRGILADGCLRTKMQNRDEKVPRSIMVFRGVQMGGSHPLSAISTFMVGTSILSDYERTARED